MATISNVQRIAALIHQHLQSDKAGLRTPAKNSAATSATSVLPGTTPSPAKAKSREASEATLRRLVSGRVRSIDPSDPQRERKAFRAFLESIILAEFGEELLNDPAFFRLVDDIQRTMEDDPDIRRLIRDAVGKLLAG